MTVQEMDIYQAVAAVTTNDVFKKMLKRKSNGQRRSFLSLLKVDVQTVQPVYFNWMSYSKQYVNNFFIFLDKDFRIIGMLEGNTWNPAWEDYEDYKRSNFSSLNVIKNRKNMTEKATHILMIPAEQRTLTKIKSNDEIKRLIKVQQEKMEDKTFKSFLQLRLQDYKRKKYSQIISDEEFQSKLKLLINHMADCMFESDDHPELVEKIKKLEWFSNDIFRFMIRLVELGKDFEDAKKQHEREVFREWYRENDSWELRKIQDCKINLAKYWKSIMGE